MVPFRTLSLALAASTLAVGCGGSSPAGTSLGRAPVTPTSVVATFTGVYDPATGALTIRADPAAAANPGALTELLPWSDGVPNSSPVNTVEIFTDPGFTPTIVVNGCNNGKQGNSFEGNVTIRSWFQDQPLRNVYAEITQLTPGNFTSCNSAAAAFNLSTAYGLWSYGNLDPVGGAVNSVTRRWRFRLRTSQAFTFKGRIMADLGPPIATAGAPEFDWWATSLVNPPRTFQRAPTTLAHVTWNGTSFVDELGGLSFVPSVATATFTSTAPNLSSPAQPYAGGFTSAAYLVADAAHGANAFNTSGDFTACVKFKPGADPGVGNPAKVLLAKGDARAGSAGWALMQMNAEYHFHYRTPLDDSQGLSDVMSYVDIGSASPELLVYDYVCGGRNGNVIYAGAHGHDLGILTTEAGSFPSAGAGLPFTIGAYPNGDLATPDAGVYELIIDSRPVSNAVMAEIVGVAEGRMLSGMVGGVATLDAVNATSMATYDPPNATSTFVVGADDTPTLYDVPPYATVPPTPDGSGLLPAGTVVQYWHPLFEDTGATGFCAGAEVLSTGPWTGVAGTLLGFEDQSTRILLNPFFLTGGMGLVRHDFGAAEAAWPAGSAHVFEACVAPASGGNSIQLYVDGNLVAAGVPTAVANLSSPAARIGLGGSVAGMWDPDGPLSGARIRRVFMCPSPDPASCN